MKAQWLWSSYSLSQFISLSCCGENRRKEYQICTSPLVTHKIKVRLKKTIAVLAIHDIVRMPWICKQLFKVTMWADTYKNPLLWVFKNILPGHVTAQKIHLSSWLLHFQRIPSDRFLSQLLLLSAETESDKYEASGMEIFVKSLAASHVWAYLLSMFMMCGYSFSVLISKYILYCCSVASWQASLI